MTTMLERAARAIAVEWYCETSHDDAVAVAAAETQWTAFESLARAALQAIREPDTKMLRAMDAESYPDSGSYTRWQAAITAILEEKPE